MRNKIQGGLGSTQVWCRLAKNAVAWKCTWKNSSAKPSETSRMCKYVLTRIRYIHGARCLGEFCRRIAMAQNMNVLGEARSKDALKSVYTAERGGGCKICENASARGNMLWLMV